MDNELTNQIVSEFVNNDIRNHHAFQELDSYNRTKRFVYLHPLTKRHQLTNELDALRKASPTLFRKEMVNADKSISRYNSAIKNNKAKTEEERQNWMQLINEYKEKLEIMERLIQS